MKPNNIFLLLNFICASLFFNKIFAEDILETQDKKITVRVLLKEEVKPQDILWKIKLEDIPDLNASLSESNIDKVNKSFKISSPGTKSKNIDSKELIITFKNGYFYINGKKILKNNIIIEPNIIEKRETNLVFNNVEYDGFFVISKFEDKFYLINFVDLESYVSSVLYGESWPGWPVDINEVFAIMCRTYVVSKIIEARKSKNKKQFDVKATNHHQTYKGYHRFEKLLTAVENTKSVVIAHNGNPINAMYDCCCGGIITAHSVGQVNFKHAPYLSRPYACTHCKDSKIFNWVAEYSAHNFLKILGPEYKYLKVVKDVQITKWDKAGIVREIKIWGANNNTAILTGKKVYSLFKSVKSLLFEVIKKGNKITIKGQGYGHLMGLCQWGARQMIKDGWDYKQVLSFYYPGTYFMKIKLKQTLV